MCKFFRRRFKRVHFLFLLGVFTLAVQAVMFLAHRSQLSKTPIHNVDKFHAELKTAHEIINDGISDKWTATSNISSIIPTFHDGSTANVVPHERQSVMITSTHSQISAIEDRSAPDKTTTLPVPIHKFKLSSLADANKSDKNCWNHFDFGMLEDWDQQASTFCGTGTGYSVPTHGSAHDPAWLRCRVHVDSHLPPKTVPHTLCDGANIILDIDKLRPSGCLPSRAGYKCGPPEIWHSFAGGALSANCARTGAFRPDQFPKDHLRDMFAAFAGVGEANYSLPGADLVDLAPVVLVVTRERTEHANFFHASTDFLNMFITLHVAGVIDGATGERRGLEDVQVLLLDEQRGPFEEAFIRPVFSPNHPVLQVSALRAAGRRRVRLRRALFAPPGYSSIMLAKAELVLEFRTGKSHGYCTARGGSRLLRGYRDFVLGGLGVAEERGGGGAGGGPAAAGELVRVTFLSRRPYTCDSVQHKTIKRQVHNEASS